MVGSMIFILYRGKKCPILRGHPTSERLFWTASRNSILL